MILGDADAEDLWNTRFDISEAIGYNPRADVIVVQEHHVREAGERLADILRTAREEGVVLYRNGQQHGVPPAADRARRRSGRRPGADGR